ncbi:VOC family protein [Myxococcus sp. CA051A]|uniref:VOC family protein n=1 Tax=Myxococcus llanfairpwllgwyngyllgogerychwyrndrobwllllantysiliogogogochensis TaxID=2590453 RepID=A0A540WXS5_9BACT|nr:MULTISPECIES: VOC family protein [Myxococcus]NTX02738.1 VOC family protein [Myxococcus sp. CA040A]NTX11161.1 VOC family protein [Myxococcus sp. CA056]NTX34747.1 VOC family protein [Myxococcus sp. CA033]NTX51655.1 VOC family protein [Myxococcus sp. CA039A]NTX60429.1 VOC family protein [Myxococcus sp. CA051A]
MSKFQRITPFLWFPDQKQTEAAVALYTSVFPNSRVVTTTRYNEPSAKVSGQPLGAVMTLEFQLDGQDFVAINGGPHFKFTEALSLVVNCESQAEVDHYWSRLSEGGDERAQQCGWLKDRFGVSWQVVPTELVRLLAGPDSEKSRRVTEAMLKMKKLDLDALRRAAG